MTDTVGDSPKLALIAQHHRGGDFTTGSAIIMDNAYKTQPVMPDDLDLHEFYPYAENKALALLHRSSHRMFGEKNESVLPGGFIDFDITTGHVLYEWMGDDIALDESNAVDIAAGKFSADFVHLNSIDKNDDGNYLISARHTDTVYLISGEDGKIIWRLGGKKNDFDMAFQFSGQHHARFMSVNATHMVLSLFNNGADDWTMNEQTSSAIYIELDLETMKARLLNQYIRPDGKSTRKRGSMQTLPNSNVFVCWSWKGYISEFNHDGDLLMEASFASDRFDTYRAHKFPWSSQPAAPPTLVSSWYGVNGSEKLTVFYVSWNGATDVKFWRFYAQANESSERVELHTVPKSGFETSYIASGYMDWVSAEALNEKHEIMGKSAVTRSTPPQHWPEGVKEPRPDNPALFKTTTAELTPEVTTTSNAVLSAVLFIAGALTSAAGFMAVFFYPVFRDHIRRSYSKLRSEESEERMPLTLDEA